MEVLQHHNRQWEADQPQVLHLVDQLQVVFLLVGQLQAVLQDLFQEEDLLVVVLAVVEVVECQCQCQECEDVEEAVIELLFFYLANKSLFLKLEMSVSKHFIVK